MSRTQLSIFLDRNIAGFMDKDSDYYAQIAKACDSVLRQNPIGSDKLLHDTASPFLWRLSPQEPTLPESIRPLNPNEIILSTNRISVCFGVSRASWGIIWGQDEDQPNIWHLATSAEGLTKIVYSEMR